MMITFLLCGVIDCPFHDSDSLAEVPLEVGMNKLVCHITFADLITYPSNHLKAAVARKYFLNGPLVSGTELWFE